MALRLQPGERVLFRGHPSWRSILGFYLRWLAITAGAALAVAVATGFTSGGTRSDLVVIVALAGVALTILGGLVIRAATTYTITDQRLHIRRGIVARTVQETRLHRVQNVNYRQTLLQRLLMVGDVDFDTATGHEYEFTFAGVAAPAEVVQVINEAGTAPARGHPGPTGRP